MIVCVCNVLKERDCVAAAQSGGCRNGGCVYRMLGVRVRCGRCVDTMHRIVEHANTTRAPIEIKEEEPAIEPA